MEYSIALLFILIPVIIIFVQHYLPRTNVINPIIPAYVAGLLLSLVLPHTAAMGALQDGVSSAAVAFSIPLMLFAVDIRGWMRAGREAIISFLLAGISVLIAVTVAHFLLAHLVQSGAEIGGLLVGVYTGGTPNLAAIRVALDVESSLYLTVHTVDLLVSAVYILLILLLGRRILGGEERDGRSAAPSGGGADNLSPAYVQIVARGNRGTTFIALGCAAAVVLLSVALSAMVPDEHATTVTILLLTTLSLLATIIPGISRLTTSFRTGEFFILIFSVAVGSMAEVERMVTTSPVIIAYLSIVVFGSLGLHFILGRIFRIRRGTIMVTSISAVCSPPFVGMLAPIVRDPRLIAAGITTGVIGYAVGNYLGVAMFWFLSAL